jgi:transposase
VHFTVQRRRHKHILRSEDPDKALLRAKARQLREEGMSYPAIANALDISVGTSWNYVQRSD